MGVVLIVGFAAAVVLFAILLSLKSSTRQIKLELSLGSHSGQEPIARKKL